MIFHFGNSRKPIKPLKSFDKFCMKDNNLSQGKRKSSAALLSVVSNTVIMLLKLTVGAVIGSVLIIQKLIYDTALMSSLSHKI